jgi:signal peptidase I
MKQRWLRKQLCHGLHLLERQRKQGREENDLEADLFALDQFLEQKKYEEASPHAKRIAARLKEASKRSFLGKTLEFVFSLVAAILVAGIIRQCCFELYEIPTGSMRPTFKEKDRVLVSKTTFGLNIPFAPNHFLFSLDRVKRGSIVVVTAEGLDMPDVDTVYFGIFPGKKRYVKRCAALPGDWVYFYGGDLFCLSADEKTIFRLQSDPSIPRREYIPFFSSFEGRVETLTPSPFSRHRTYLLKHMNLPLGRIEVNPDGSINCQIPQNGGWVNEFSAIKDASHRYPRSIGEFWGIHNFAMSRLLLPEDLPKEASRLGYEDPKAVLWLELRHSPTLPPSGKIKQSSFPLVATSSTWIPLRSEHCERLMHGLYTARLVIQNDHLRRYHYEVENGPTISLPVSIPDGCYEFYNGTAFEISSFGTATPLPDNHPIYPKTQKELAFWFNIGIDASSECLSPSSRHMPTRYTYFRDGNLFVMGTSVFSKGDPILKFFEGKEITRQAKDYTYFAFQDMGSPDTTPLDTSFFHQFGYKVPQGHYLLLGDNPAMSVDSRFFGPVPEENIQGTPVLLFWPFGERWGRPSQPSLPPSPYTVTLFCITAAGIAIYVIRQRRRTNRELEKLRKKDTVQK